MHFSKWAVIGASPIVWFPTRRAGRKISIGYSLGVVSSAASQNAIAKACDINRANLNAFIHDRRALSLETVEKIAEHVRLELRWRG